ncbi:MAG: polysaccharide biosynthesis tyrosine autokinase [Puniceicoccaceae bacterium]|nr:MAG: polysaccharide biosynthesis tyrosine autokinase [Puniceicoccaceae bacterium]
MSQQPPHQEPESTRPTPHRYAYSDSGIDSSPYGEGGPQRSIKDYILILRERIWYIIIIFLAVFSAALIYTLTRPKVYEAVASVEILRTSPVVLQVQDVLDPTIRTTEDFNTQVRRMESISLIQRVASRLTGEEMRRFMAPYETGDASDPVTPIEIIGQNRRIMPLRLSLVISVQYRHRDPVLAARVADLFVEEFINLNTQMRIQESLRAVEDLRDRAEQQRKVVEDLELRLQAFREDANMISLDQRRDIVTEKLKMLNMMLTEAAARRNEAAVRWNLVQQYREEGRPLTEISFIANNPIVNDLRARLAAKEIEMAQLRDRYRDLHPTMIEARNSIQQTRTELNQAVEQAAARVHSEFQTAERSVAEARAALSNQESEALNLGRLAVSYDSLANEAQVNELIYQSIVARMRETTMTSTLESGNARVVDSAMVPLRPASPNVRLNLGLGLLGGLGLGLGVAFFIAILDDRVKSAFDIESVVGLPLIGLIPRLRKMEVHEKAQIVLNNEDRQAVEAFRTLHSSLKLHDESKNAQALLITSTTPGEGKSFTATNLALTYAQHGEKTLLIDCDLRKPNIHQGLQLENDTGLIDFVRGNANFDALAKRSPHENLDVILTGGRAKQPSQILNSADFERFIAEARQRYQRIIIDTPPLAAVSDSLILLPLVDGALFTIQFNRVKRKAAQTVVRRLSETSVPVFGAILNGLNLSLAGYYYAQYYDKSYKDYYVVTSEDEKEMR